MKSKSAILNDKDMMVLGTVGRFQDDGEELTPKAIKEYLPLNLEEVYVSVGHLISKGLMTSTPSMSLTDKGLETFQGFSKQGVL